ncbi:MAG: hypothetical protein AB8B79_21385 [Granulosicoccus sp.]
MTNISDQTLEHILIDTVEKELDLMRSFCQASFSPDVSSVVAVRMSRSMVSTICRMNNRKADSRSELFTEENSKLLVEAVKELERLSVQFESRLGTFSENELAWLTWNA